MKSLGTVIWDEPNLGATNLCNFSAMPGGQRNAAGGFSNTGNYGNWWSSTPTESETAWSRNVNYNDTQINSLGSDWNFGYSVRCVKD
jgi:uncharacterized protein (TIGR02145 family)